MSYVTKSLKASRDSLNLAIGGLHYRLYGDGKDLLDPKDRESVEAVYKAIEAAQEQVALALGEHKLQLGRDHERFS